MLIEEAYRRAKAKEEEKVPVLHEVKLEVAYNLISEVNRDICNTSCFAKRDRERKDEVTDCSLTILRQIIYLSQQLEEFHNENHPEHSA